MPMVRRGDDHDIDIGAPGDIRYVYLFGTIGIVILRNGEMVESVIGRAYRAAQRARLRGGNQCGLDS